MSTLLQVDHLNVWFGSRQVVRGLSFSMGREKLGVVGESGSGKSVSMRAILGLLPPAARVLANRIGFGGDDITRPDAPARRGLLGARASLVMQDPRHALNPVMTIGDQIAEAFRQHVRLSRAELRDRVLEALEQVRLRDPRRVAGLYPHEVSGGMGQRAMIAMMLAPDPALLVADEPTSALDATVEAGILDTLNELVEARGMGLILISHDLDLVRDFCDRVLVMYAGRVLEACDSAALADPAHPYTRGLIASVPRLGDSRAELPVLQRDPAWTT